MESCIRARCIPRHAFPLADPDRVLAALESTLPGALEDTLPVKVGTVLRGGSSSRHARRRHARATTQFPASRLHWLPP